MLSLKSLRKKYRQDQDIDAISAISANQNKKNSSNSSDFTKCSLEDKEELEFIRQERSIREYDAGVPRPIAEYLSYLISIPRFSKFHDMKFCLIIYRKESRIK